ncbi:gamma-glutamylcyclotransferase [Pseudaminobacter sp. 19-2017]|uniref:Gamma-glutamylcyclotransferase n=1 Tax=Pseudaminobacter soli (ex Zhang et al. 2022) TaxID=2831468 RepID=A0A942E1Z3_9HYPH|nr:gamma-glutamylcyclotransferase family protein [Pseudaminobacter soli]MBS3651946.1 gamma-glutamylcyclotransferase [Pseudaminobacter soli]
MTSFLYFGYGSNMLTARLKARCESTTPVCVASAEGYRLTFAKPSNDGSGKGHLAKAHKRVRQAGVLFEIDMAERGQLDDAEGVGAGYYREDAFPVRRHDTKEIVHAAVYLAQEPDLTRVPYDWYLALIVAGAREHHFDRRRMRELLASKWQPHTKSPWGNRNEALGLLQAAGVGDDLAAYFTAQADIAKPRPRRVIAP